MTFDTFVSRYAKKHGKKMREAREICESVVDLMDECVGELEPDERMYLYGFGSFTKKIKGGKKAFDFKLGEVAVQPEREVIIFKRSNTVPAREKRRKRAEAEAKLIIQ